MSPVMADDAARRAALLQAQQLADMGYDINNLPGLEQATQEELKAYEEGQREFERMQQSGEIPKGAKYTGTESGNIKYIPAEEMEKAAERGRQFVSQAEVRTKALRELKDFKAPGGYDLTAAIKGGKIESVRKAGFAPADIVEAQGRAADVPKVVATPSKKEPSAYQQKVLAEYEKKGKITIGPVPEGHKFTPVKESEGWQSEKWGHSWMAMPVVAAGTKAGPVAIIAGAVAFLGAEAYANNKKDIDNAIARAIDTFQKRTGRVPSPAEVVVADRASGQAVTLAEMKELPKLYETGSHGIKPVNIVTGTTGIKAVNIKTGAETKTTHLPETGKKTPANSDAMGPTTKITWKEPVILLPGTQTPIPKSAIHDKSKLSERAGMMVAAGSQVITTARPYIDFADVERQVRERQIQNVEKALAAGETRELHRERAIAGRKTRRAQEDERRRMISRSRRHSRMNELRDTVDLAYKAALAQKLSVDVKRALLKSYADYQARAKLYDAAMDKFSSSAKLAPAYGTLNKAASEAAVEALARTQTSQAEQLASQTLAQTTTQTATETPPGTTEATRAKEATRTRTGERTTTDEATRPAEKTVPREAEKTKERVGTPSLPRVRIPLPRGASDKEKREYIKKSGGAVAFRMGQLNGKDVWHVVVAPFESKSDYMTVMGTRPSGATVVRGPESAYKTAQLVYGARLPKDLSFDIGAVDTKMSPRQGKKVSIAFSADPKQLTQSDINVSGGKKVFPLPRT